VRWGSQRAATGGFVTAVAWLISVVVATWVSAAAVVVHASMTARKHDNESRKTGDTDSTSNEGHGEAPWQ
jgi:hypothetical protein